MKLQRLDPLTEATLAILAGGLTYVLIALAFTF